MPMLEQGGILRLNVVLDYIFFMSEAILQALNTWLKQFSQEEPSKTVGDNIALLMMKFLDCRVRLSDVNSLSV